MDHSALRLSFEAMGEDRLARLARELREQRNVALVEWAGTGWWERGRRRRWLAAADEFERMHGLVLGVLFDRYGWAVQFEHVRQ